MLLPMGTPPGEQAVEIRSQIGTTRFFSSPCSEGILLPLLPFPRDPECILKKAFFFLLAPGSASRRPCRCNLAGILHATLFDPDDIS